MRDMGFTAVYDLSQGIVTWDGPIEDGSTAAEQPAASEPGAATGQDTGSAALPVMYEFYTDS
jgi:hypothetical protein